MKYTVKEEQTILEFLQKINSGWSKKKIKSLLYYQSIFIQKKGVKKLEEKVFPGQIVEIKDTKKIVQDKRLKILYEDQDFIAVDKPAGILSISDATKEETMYQIVSHYVKEKNPKNKIFVLHRLDKETSGVLVFSKNEKMKYRMQENWNHLVKEREYIAIVEGSIPNQKGTIKTYLVESSTHFVYVTKNQKEGKLSITNYEKIKEENGYTWLRINLETGRKNQIRVSLKELHTVVAGDKKYGSKKNPFNRLGLHATKLSFQNPVTKEVITIKSPLPNTLKRV